MKTISALSIVTPTRGDFSEDWFDRLLSVRGDVEFILVYPPGMTQKTTIDPRVRVLVSPYRGEMMQRFIGFLNATGQYILALDDDDFVHPDVLQLTLDYFERFPDSWMMRLRMKKIDLKNTQQISADWSEVPKVSTLRVEKSSSDETRDEILQEIPIAPLTKKFDVRYLFWPWIKRRDMEGAHLENFNNKVWRNDLVQQVLPDISQATQMIGAIVWIPRSAFDRLMGLFLQAKFFHPDTNIGHWLPPPEQIRFIDKDPALKPPRFHVTSDFLLVNFFW